MARGGADLCAVTAPDDTYGYTANTGFGDRLADDFTVPAGLRWNITGASFLGYTTNATTVTLKGATVRIFAAPPSAGGTPLFGNTSTNRQTSAGWLGPTAVYRAVSTDPLNTQRRIEYSHSSFNVSLGPGTYWIDDALTSTTGSVFSPPLSVIGGDAVPTGNALQYSGVEYGPMFDAYSGYLTGIPFQLFGTAQPIPEPTSFALAALGTAGWLVLGRRRNKPRPTCERPKS